ncbi:hypothetical protein HPB50_027449 [Hyalomma asiaticum]|uniref:Uncharacterized protein n=1 Tax=Hyalomma asiaticum TaxID=266040 RepID=A0ACB7S5U4_HYAAI|nr:hypothetical protein HPB50_027449 [Hyalomma asiaticum]
MSDNLQPRLERCLSRRSIANSVREKRGSTVGGYALTTLLRNEIRKVVREPQQSVFPEVQLPRQPTVSYADALLRETLLGVQLSQLLPLCGP